MKSSMMTVAVMAALGLSGLAHAAQQEQKAAEQGRVKAEYETAARKCDGLSGDARNACLKAARDATQGKSQGGATAPARRMPDEKK